LVRGSFRGPVCGPSGLRPLFALSLLTLGLLTLGACGHDEDPLSRQRSTLKESHGLNVIVVSFDALRPDYLGTHGHPRNVSPRIDQFADESIVFERAYSVAPVTPTSFAAAFSGSLPPRGFRAWRFVTGNTLAERFRAEGYETVAFMNNVQLTAKRGFDRGFDDYRWFKNVSAIALFNQVQAWLDEPREGPFFVWVHFLPPHAPYRFRPRAEHLYDPAYEGPFEKTTGVTFSSESDEDTARIRSLYEGEIFVLDDVFGRFLDSLSERGLDRNSIVVFTSDHGEEFGEHGGFQHGLVYEEHLRIPFMIRHPRVEEGIRTDRVYRNIDLLPTLVGLIGAETEEGLDGVDLFSQEAPSGEVVGISMTAGNKWDISLLDEDQKVILSCQPTKSAQLCDTTGGGPDRCVPGEERAPETRRLLAQLEGLIGGDPCEVVRAAVRGADPTTGLDEETIKGLRALGYLD